MNICVRGFAAVALIVTAFCVNFLTAQTPFAFIQRNDVQTEIGVSQTQIMQVNQLQSLCDALCQQRVRDSLTTMDPDLQSQFQQLDARQMAGMLQALEQDMQETVELEALEDQVLDARQMNRFSQLWTQAKGLDSLISGPSGRQLGLSNIQINQVQNIRSLGSAAIDQCRQNSQFSSQQQLIQIQNIQINVVNQCANILTDEQVRRLAEMCGEPFRLDSSEPGPMSGDLPGVSDSGTPGKPDLQSGGSGQAPGENSGTSSGRPARQNQGGESRGAAPGTDARPQRNLGRSAPG